MKKKLILPRLASVGMTPYVPGRDMTPRSTHAHRKNKSRYKHCSTNINLQAEADQFNTSTADDVQLLHDMSTLPAIPTTVAGSASTRPEQTPLSRFASLNVSPVVAAQTCAQSKPPQSRCISLAVSDPCEHDMYKKKYSDITLCMYLVSAFRRKEVSFFELLQLIFTYKINMATLSLVTKNYMLCQNLTLDVKCDRLKTLIDKLSERTLSTPSTAGCPDAHRIIQQKKQLMYTIHSRCKSHCMLGNSLLHSIST